jgi:hypothetical protein
MPFAEALAGRMFNRRVSLRVGVRGGVVAATGRNGGGSGGGIIAAILRLSAERRRFAER